MAVNDSNQQQMFVVGYEPLSKIGPLILSEERKKYNRDNYYKLLRLKNCVLTLAKQLIQEGQSAIMSYTHETEYFEKGGAK